MREYIQALVKEITTLIMFLFEPEFIGFSAVVVMVYRKASKFLEKRSKAVVAGVVQRQDQQEKDVSDMHLIILRLELIVGTQSNILSESEVLKMVDVYHGLGGNSYITRMCDDYIMKKRIEREEEDDEQHHDTKEKE